MRRSLIGLLAGALVSATFLVAGPAQAVQTPQGGVVTADPADFTPHVLDGDVYAVAEVGGMMVLGGAFTKARNAPTGSPVVTRSNLLAFDKATGVLSETFAPVVNGAVRSLVASADGTSVYVGGQFSAIDGRNSFKLAQLRVDTGQPVTAFKPGRIDAVVMDVRLHGDRLVIGGKFVLVNGQPRTYLAELSPTTGELRPTLDLAIQTPVWSGTPFVYKTDISPDGTRMVVLGNFRSIGGHLRTQVAMLDLTTEPVSVLSWSSPAFDVACHISTTTQYDVRDVDFSPDGSYFVIGATGGKPGPGAVCDGVSRWETDREGPGQQPTWFAMTGGDSVYSVASTGAAVYAGGHFRWFNNQAVQIKAPGAVDREGIAALDPVTGLPLRWNPGRDRGQAVWDLVATADGLWVGNDTDRIGRYEYHARIAYFPLVDGGTPVPQPATLPLPVDIQLIAPASSPDSLVRRSDFTGSAVGTSEVLPAAGTGWAAVRGGFVAAGSLYAVKADGTMVKRPVVGDGYGPESLVDLNGLTAFATEIPSVTSMFYAEGRLYYTLSGKRSLYMRFFTVESDIVGGTRFEVAGGAGSSVNWRDARGAFLVEGALYLASASTGKLARVGWAGHAPTPGAPVTVSGPGINGVDWRSAGMFVRPAS